LKTLRKVRILIVDDEVRVAELLAESVRMQGYEAIVASSGTEGLALLEQRHPEAVFLDIVMPQMNGIEVLRRIRETNRNLPVIVITGHASPEQIDEARRLGITECIEKPFVLKQISEALLSLETGKP
jgi:CheY-like chemotaxis protein